MRFKLNIKLPINSNVHKISRQAGISYMTARKYLLDPGGLKSIDLEILYKIIMAISPMFPEDLLSRKLGDLFDVKVDDER